ncbi:protein SPIRRIG [Phalaenopsis equestris]|uniref:protein SPIRRIG n=1 Tax=Phalaenopsis equestris TaxID=78828 RepID=UPI0009E1DEBC|nr:protein SPIRRIG [Phalaenopsis equestris]
MFQSSRKTMRWASLLKDIKEKVGLSHSQHQSANSFDSGTAAATASGAGASEAPDFSATPHASPSSSPARGKYELEVDFKRFWEEFRSSSFEKEKEEALNMALDAFCRLVKEQYDVAQLFNKLVEAHIFSFVVGRAFVTDVEKLRMYTKGRVLQAVKVIKFFSDVTKDGMCPGSNFLYALEVLVTGPVDKQPLLDSGILCCLIQILNALLNPDESSQMPFVPDEAASNVKSSDGDTLHVRRLEVEGSVVHIMKALASHPSAALSLIEDDSLQLLFHMVTNGSLNVFSQFKDGLVRLHTIQLHRHAMQILGLLLTNDNGSTANYIHKHHLIKVLLTAVKDFNPEKGDPVYTMGIIDLLLECVELSSKPDAGQIRLREDIHNAHGYQYLVQFALTLSSLHRYSLIQSVNPDSSFQKTDSDGHHSSLLDQEFSSRGEALQSQVSPTLSRLLDVLVNLAQTGPVDTISPVRGSKSSYGKASAHSRSRTSSQERLGDEMWEKGNMRIKDLEAIQMMQDIFLKADNVELQAEVLNRMFKIFSSHLDNYKLCQQLRTVPLFILNMAGFPASFQEIILKILEYFVTVVNCIPEQELLSLCCLLQQPISTDLKHKILAFFVKLLSFDQQYKKVLREVGVLEVLLDDLRQHKFNSGIEQQNNPSNSFERTLSSRGFKKHIEDKDAILSSPRFVGSGSWKFPIFEDEATIAVAWDCLSSLLKKAETNQQSFRSCNGVITVLPFLTSDSHRSGALRLLSCLIIEDSLQAHHEELGSLVEILKSGMITNVLGSQYKLENDAKCDIFGTLWRILGSNNSAQRVFGEATGFSLLLTTLHSFQSSYDTAPHSSLIINTRVFSFLLRVITAGVCGNPINRVRLHTIISSQTFYDLLCESGLLCVDREKQVIQLLLELALEIVTPPSVQTESGSSSDTFEEESNFLNPSLVIDRPDNERVYNESAVGVLIRSLLLFTPKVQLDLLKFIEKLANASAFNQESLTSIGSIGLLLEMINPFLDSSSPLLSHTLKIVEILGAYRLSSSELQILVRYVVQMKAKRSGHLFVDMLEKLIQTEDTRVQSVSLAPFVEMDMSKVGYASVHVSLGERTWPPAAGYSFVCWFQFINLLKSQVKDSEPLSKAGSSRSVSGGVMLRVFSVGAANDGNTFYAELYLQDNGVLTLATSSSLSLSFPGMELDEGRWHHLAVVHSKPNALAGLFQSSVAYLYLDGKLRHTGKLGYSPSPIGKSLMVTLGSAITRAKVTDLSWRLGSCYLFEEVLTAGNIFFMYILGQGYRGLFQDTDLLRFVPKQACGGGNMALLDSLDAKLSLASNVQKADASAKQVNPKMDGSGIVWDLERLVRLASQLSGKKLIFSFDGTSFDAFRASGTFSLLNLVDPTSAAASPIGGIPRYGRFNGDTYICNKRVIGDTLRMIGGMSVVLALIEAAETRDMLHMVLELLACSLHQCPQNMHEMQALRGYHLLSLFLHRKMSLFDLPSLEIFFQIAACEACFSEPQKSKISKGIFSPSGTSAETSLENLSLPKFSDEISSIGSQGDLDDFSIHKDSFSHISELDNSDLHEEISNCFVLSNADMVEHVLLDWTLWVTAPVSVQIALLGFLERLVSIHWYRNHNLSILRRINLVQHLLVTLQRGDVEVSVLEKLVVLLGVILEDGFLASELQLVVRFVIMTFDPPVQASLNQVVRETMGKHVIVRNMLLEMLIDLQVTIKSDELLEQWHKIVSSKLITYFLDEAVHPTSMRWIMTLLGVCLASSPTFTLKFLSSGGFQGLTRVLPSFYDSPEIYYILFCLIFGKAVYPRVPEVRMLDFHALMPSDDKYGELKFVELLESVVTMAKNTFDRLSMQVMLAQQNDNMSHLNGGLVSELADAREDMGGDLQGEALMHKTYAARLMGGEAAAPATAMSILRFMVDLAKMCPPFSAICRRPEFLENCVDLYFSCLRADCAMKMAKNLKPTENDEKTMIDNDDNSSSQNTYSSLPVDHEQSTKTSVSLGSFPREMKSTSSEDIVGLNPLVTVSDVSMDSSPNLESITTGENLQTLKGHNSFSFETSELKLHDSNGIADLLTPPTDLSSSASLYPPDSPVLSEKSFPKLSITPASPVPALTSWLGSTSIKDAKAVLPATSPIGSSLSMKDFDTSPDARALLHGSSAANTYFPINSKLLLEIDDYGYVGGPCSAGATAILDFVALVLADVVLEQLKATQFLETILEAVPLYIDADSALVFQGLCLGRLLNFLERRLLLDDEENEKKLDKSRWSVNLDSLCWMIVDRVYMGSFPQPVGVLRTLEFLLSMLQLSNKDGRIQDASPVGKGLLYITRGSRQLEAYIHAILKNTNRMLMYCFMPSFLATIAEDEFLSNLGFLVESGKVSSTRTVQDESTISICTVLQLIVANKRLILCPSNLDTDLVCCLCINLISLFRDKRQTARELAVDIFKHLLLHRRPALEDLLVSKPNQGKSLDVLHGGFDKLLTGSFAVFFEWFWKSEQTINMVLEQCAAIMWVQYVAGSAKFPGVRIKGMEVRRKREMGRKLRDTSRFDLRHLEQMNERRYALELVRDLMATELRVIRQDKYGWVLHAESEWHTHLQQLVHECGIFPVHSSASESEWQLCPIEGPYRMRKKLERCSLKLDIVQSILKRGFGLEDNKILKEKPSGADSDPYFNLLAETGERKLYGDDEESLFKDIDQFKAEMSGLAQSTWTDDRCSSVNEPNLQFAQEPGVKSSSGSARITESFQARSDLGSPRQSFSMRDEDLKGVDEKSEKELHDNGEYLIRPYLKPSEKIRFKYNCERVVGLDKQDGIFLIGDLCLYVIENFYIDDSGCICEKETEDELSVIDRALGVKKDLSGGMEFQLKSHSTWSSSSKSLVGGRAWAYNGGAWGKEKVCSSGNLPHSWHMWKLDNVYELVKRDYQLRPVAIEIFSMDGHNDLLVFHKKERDEVFKNLVAMNLPRNNMLDTTISGASKQDGNEGSRLFRISAKSFSKRWQNGEISNFQYLMHLNTLAGRGYSDLTQYPVFPWVLADYESEILDLFNPKTFRKLDKPMGCQTPEGEEEFKKRYESWDDPDVPKFHYGSHYSSAGIVLFYLLRLPPFSSENQTLQGGQFDHADRLFNSVRDTWLSAAGRGNTSDVKELIPEFFYLPEFLENRFNLDFGEKQSGEKVGDVILPPWAKGSPREFIRKHREALESDYVSENLHNWIDLIFGYKQRGKAAEDAINVFYHYTYEGNVDIDAVTDPAMKASILAQINHFGQTPKQLFLKPHVRRHTDRKIPLHPLRYSAHLLPHEIRKSPSSISQIITFHDKVITAAANNRLKPITYSKYIAWGFPDRSVRIINYDQDRLLSTHENLHGGNQILCTGVSHDGQILVTGGDDGVVAVWRFSKDNIRAQRSLHLARALCAHTTKVTCLYVSQPYSLIASGSEDCTVILWDLSSLSFVKQLPKFPAPVSAIHVNDLTGEILTAAGVLLGVWSINGDCLAVVNTSQLPSDLILSVTCPAFSDWQDTNWYVTGHQSGAVKIWNMVHCRDMDESGVKNKSLENVSGGLILAGKAPEYILLLHKVLKSHKHPVTALHITNDLKQLLTGDSGGHLLSWSLAEDILRSNFGQG